MSAFPVECLHQRYGHVMRGHNDVLCWCGKEGSCLVYCGRRWFWREHDGSAELAHQRARPGASVGRRVAGMRNRLHPQFRICHAPFSGPHRLCQMHIVYRYRDTARHAASFVQLLFHSQVAQDFMAIIASHCGHDGYYREPTSR